MTATPEETRQALLGEDLTGAAWRAYEASVRRHFRFVVTPSVPILFFGDSIRYSTSALKVITVGLNPSKREFPTRDRFERFPRAREAYPAILTGSHAEEYLRALDDYFRVAPYSAWFNRSFERLLRGMGCSYYDSNGSTALHTDLCSPIATDPAWSSLNRPDRDVLYGDGVALWHTLVRALRPDIVLISVARAHLTKLAFPVGTWRTLYTIPHAAPYRVEAARVKIAGNKIALLVFDPAAQTPFGFASGDHQELMGRAILEEYRIAERTGGPDTPVSTLL